MLCKGGFAGSEWWATSVPGWYRSTWFSVILHFGQSIFLIFLILGRVLGLA
jgi:hypothetical protein